MSGERWVARPAAAALVRGAVLLAPLALAVAAGAATASALDGVAWRLPLVLAVTTVVLVVTDRLARRLLPLAVLLRLSLLFPDRAPARLRLALRAGSTRSLARVGAGATPEGAAAREVLALLARTARHDRGTRRHSERVRAYVDLLAEALRLPREDTERLRWAALLHDVGKVRVPRSVLGKRGRLDAAEWQQVRLHPAEGERLAAGLRPFLGPWFDAIGQHHERWDGSGYPAGLAGEAISYGARVVAVADAFEVMTAPRSYKPATDPAGARAELVRCAGTQFDPDVVRAMLGVSLERLRRVLGPAAWFGVLPFSTGPGPDADEGADPGPEPGHGSLSPAEGADAAGDDVLAEVGLHPAATLGPGAATHGAATPSGHDAGGGTKASGTGDPGGPDPGSGVEHR